MSEHDLSAKLAQGMRRAKQPASTEPSVGGAIAASSAQARERALAAQATGQGDDAASAEQRPGRFADQSDQAPPASLDRPWENLHPKRIWPD